jgi:mono/diheme cytochrome c family protein
MKPDRKNLSPQPAAGSGGAGNYRSTAGGNSGKQDESEPTAGLAHTPIWLVMLFGALFYWSQIYLDDHAGEFSPQVFEPYASFKQVNAANPKSGAEVLIARGEVLYTTCAACHQLNGLGGATPPAPPLAGSDWVNAPLPNRIIRIPLHGLSGTIKINDQEFTGSMAALGSALSNEDLAAILSYIRQAWGNKASPVTPEQVDAVRKETAGRAEDGSASWTAEELLKIPDR